MSEPILTLEQISDKTKLPLRGLRYVCDRDIVEIAIRAFKHRTECLRRGMSRRFHLYDAFVVCLAEMLRQAGLDGPSAGLALRRLADWVSPREFRASNYDRLLPLCSHGGQVIVEVGDAAFIRAELRPEVDEDRARELPIPGTPLPWTIIHTGQTAFSDYTPLVTARLDLALLRQRLGIVE